MRTRMYRNPVSRAKEKLKKLTCVMYDKGNMGDYRKHGNSYQAAEKRYQSDREVCRGLLHRQTLRRGTYSCCPARRLGRTQPVP